MSTFADLGIPFPLFEARTDEASDYDGVATCRLCRRAGQHCFNMGIGSALILPCPACGAENGLRADDRKDAPCRSCGVSVPFPEALRTKKQMLVCYDCLRAGKGAMSKSTELGLVTWENAIEGVTGGVPGRPTEQFELVLTDADPDGDWYGSRVPNEHLWELLRTPGISSWQGEDWLFCCRRPMTYLGGWRTVLEKLRPEDPAAFCDALFDPDDEVRTWGYEAFEYGNLSLYTYRCGTCGRLRGTWDSD